MERRTAAANLEKFRLYQAKYRAKNKQKCNEANRAHRAKNSVRINAEHRERRSTQEGRAYMALKCREYQVKKRSAIPAWANSEFERLVFAEAYHLARLRGSATGVKWHVDHVVPIQGETVCGLHCAANIQLLPARSNISKGNRGVARHAVLILFQLSSLQQSPRCATVHSLPRSKAPLAGR